MTWFSFYNCYNNIFGGGSYMVPTVNQIKALSSSPLFRYTGGGTSTALPYLASSGVSIPSGLNDVSALSWLKKAYNTTKRVVSNTVSSVTNTISGFGDKMIATARRYLGYNEKNGSYKLFTNGRTEAWCADFVSYVARQCGIKNFNFPSVSGIWNWGVKNGKFSKTPTKGSAIIFKGAGSSHTGIVTKVENGRVYTIEGNTSDKVAERSYALNDKRITGYVAIA